MNDSECQEAVFALLADPATHGGAAVKRIDTHAASVFLAGDRAFKVKRAVRFPFLDYSTLPKRKSACEAELRINQPFAPEIYRRVVAITSEAAEFVVLAIPESTHAAMFAVFPPKVDIDASIGIERSDEFIAMLVRARRKFLRAGEIEPDALEHVR